jgi:FAD/FMN-containing dehydrogenase
MLRVGPGRKMIDIDRDTRPNGWELRMHPSTKRTATIGGFVAGGSGGVGSVTWGGLREPGNVAAARIVTIEAEPRVIELREAEAQAVNHAYGTTGLITELEMPMAPAWNWTDMIIAFPTFMDAVRFGYAVALAHRHGSGTITFEQPTTEAPGEVPLYEFTWNHTTLQMLARDRGVTYLQALHPAARLLDSVAEIETLFAGEFVPHLEFLRVGGQVTASGLPIVRYTTEDRLNQIIAEHRARGVSIANPHVFTLEDGVGHKQVDSDQLSFKRHADPHGLLNPGKMRSFQAVA